MSDYNNGNTSTGFFSKIKENYGSKLTNLKPSAEKDGSTEDDTLIHNAFVKYFDDKHTSYPEWLGVVQNKQQSNHGYSKDQYMYSQYQPVHHNNSFNNSYHQHAQQAQQLQAQQAQPAQQSQNSSYRNFETNQGSSYDNGRPIYQRKSSSRLEDMHNKSRQQSIPGSGYNAQVYQPQGTGRSNSIATASRLRERMMSQNNQAPLYQSNTDGHDSNSRATWGRRY